MTVPLMGGVPAHVWGGMVLLLLIVLQVLLARRVLPVSFVWHRRNGYLILVLGCIHALVGMGIWFGGFRVG
ncbi:MAG: hypothetical protein QHH05_03950 [Syntrophomonadaceae bacterium]|nr:hypothetical protein [Syntrophomonadaceae bacterium]